MAIKTEDGYPLQIELERIKLQLAESEARCRALALQSPDNLLVHDLNGKILFTNESRVGVFGAKSSEEIIGRNAREFIHPDDRERVMGIIGAALEDYKNGRDSKRVIEHRMLRLDGTGFYGEATGVCFAYNGEPAIQTVIRDITARKRVEEELKEEKERTDLAQKAGKVGTWDWDLDSGRLVWSDELYSILGLEPGSVEPTYEFFLERLHPDDRQGIERAVNEALTKSKPYRVDCRVLKDEGTEVIAEAIGKVGYCENGTVSRMFGTFKDVSARKGVEAKLEESLQRHQALFENMLSAAAYHKMLFDDSGVPVDYIFLDINDAFEKNTGLKREDVIGKRATEVIPGIEDFEPDLIELYGEVASTGTGRTFDLNFAPFEKCFSVSAYCPEKGFFVATFVDVTERRKAEAALQQTNLDLERKVEVRTDRLTLANKLLGQEVVERKRAKVELKEAVEKFRIIFESSDDAIIVMGKDGFLEFNDAALRIFGCSVREELLGADPAQWSPAIQPDGRNSIEAVKLEVDRAFAKGRNSFEWTLQRADGELFPAEVLLVPMYLNGVKVIHATVRDITERRTLEGEKAALQLQLLHAQKMEAIGTLAGGIAHDFNNVLTVVKSLSALALTKVEPENPLKQYLDPIFYASERGTGLVQQLLIFSQSKPCEVETIDLNDTISDTLVMMRTLIDDDISIEEEFNSDAAGIEADRGRIEQVLTNLLINSSDALPQGGHILIRTENVTVKEEETDTSGDARPGDYVRLSVEDNGIGMDKETAEHIFEPFFTTKSPSGTGLGLSVVYGILQEMQGWIEVRSEPGAGTTFTVYLPASIDSTADAPCVRLAEPYVPVGGQGRRILLVEDDKWVRKSTAMALVDNGYTVFEAVDAEDAISQFYKEKGEFDLVISDVVMPGRDGLEMMEPLFEIRPDIAVLFYSGHVGDKAQLETIMKRGLPFLQKPYEIPDLLKAVEEGIGHGAR